MKTHRHRNTARGMTLIEVLVTLVIISVGLLGVAALQLTTVRNNFDAFVRSQAAVLASDMLDRIRANRAAAMTTPSGYDIGFGTPPTPNTVAQQDIVQWKGMLAAQLPSGDGSIATNRVLVDGVTRHIVTITISWNERGIAPDQTRRNEAITFVTSSQI